MIESIMSEIKAFGGDIYVKARVDSILVDEKSKKVLGVKTP